MSRVALRATTLAVAILAGCSNGASPLMPGIPAIAFAKRVAVDLNGNAVIGDRQVLDYLRYVPGGGVYVLEPPTPSGQLRCLTCDQAAADIQGLDTSFDGRSIVFAMKTSDTDRYHLYVANVDGSPMDGGSNARPYRQITFGDADDVYPAWAPGERTDRIYFVTNQPSITGIDSMGTRADEYGHARAVTQLAWVSVLYGDAERFVCSENLSHSVFPFLRADGRIGYSRWEHLGTTNDVKLFAMNPDCTAMVALAGQHGNPPKPSNSLVEVREIPGQPNHMVGVGTSRDRTIHAGALVEIVSQGPRGGARDIDEEGATYEVLTPSVPLDRSDSPDGRYRTPYPLDGTRILTSWAAGFVSERNELANTSPNFGIYLWDSTTGSRALVYDDPQTWEVFALPVGLQRTRPMPLPPSVGPGTAMRIGAVDVAQTSLVETVAGAGPLAGQPLADAIRAHGVAARVVEGFSTEVGTIRLFGITPFEGTAILGETPIYADGSFAADVPSRIPLRLQIVDEFGLSIRSEGLWIQGIPGETRTCGACHERRTGTVLPRSGQATIAEQAGVGAVADGVTNLAFSVVGRAIPLPGQNHGELPWDGTIQPIFDRSCVRCHSAAAPPCASNPGLYPACDPFGGQSYSIRYTDPQTGATSDYVIPVLDLSSTPMAVIYDRLVATYPVSYVSLLIPGATLRFTEVIDPAGVYPTVPWVVLASARSSRLIEKLNLEAPDTTRFLPGVALHPEDVGETSLTAEDRLNLARMIDLGGQYYSRLNVPNPILGMGCTVPPCP